MAAIERERNFSVRVSGLVKGRERAESYGGVAGWVEEARSSR